MNTGTGAIVLGNDWATEPYPLTHAGLIQPVMDESGLLTQPGTQDLSALLG